MIRLVLVLLLVLVALRFVVGRVRSRPWRGHRDGEWP